MATAKYTGPSDCLELYAAAVGAVDGMVLKGATMPYTSRNGHMTSFLDKEGSMAIRLGPEDRAAFVDLCHSHTAYQHGKVMQEFVVVPGGLLERPEELRDWLARSWEWVGTLEPKPTKR